MPMLFGCSCLKYFNIQWTLFIEKPVIKSFRILQNMGGLPSGLKLVCLGDCQWRFEHDGLISNLKSSA